MHIAIKLAVSYLLLLMHCTFEYCHNIYIPEQILKQIECFAPGLKWMNPFSRYFTLIYW